MQTLRIAERGAAGWTAESALDPTTLTLLWPRGEGLASLPVDKEEPRFGCARQSRHALLRPAGGGLYLVAVTAQSSAHDGDGCRVTVARFIDEAQ